MKALILLSVLSVPSLTFASHSHKVTLEAYRYAGTLSGLTKALEKQLAEQIRSKCGDDKSVKMRNLEIDIDLGELSSGDGLPVEVLQEDGKSRLNFPHHPRARLTADLLCR